MSTPYFSKFETIALIEAQITDSTLVADATIPIDPLITGNAHTLGTGPGTYPYWGGMVIPDNNTGTLQRVAGVFSVSLTPVPGLVDYVTIDSEIKNQLQVRNGNENSILLEKYREINLDYDTFVYTDFTNVAGVTPVYGHSVIWGTTTDGFLVIPITIDLAAPTKHLGVIIETNCVLNPDSVVLVNGYLSINGGAAIGFNQITYTRIGNKTHFVGWFDLSSVTSGDTLDLIIVNHAAGGVEIATELDTLRLFYIDEDVIGDITVGDSLASTILIINEQPKELQILREYVYSTHSSNYLNPDTFKYDYFYFAGQIQELQYLPANGYGLSDFIVVNGQNFTTTGAGRSINGLSSYAVFDIDKTWLRNGQDTDTYIYVDGDYFVQFVYNGITDSSNVTSKAVTLGDTYVFEEYSENILLNEIEDTILLVETSNENLREYVYSTHSSNYLNPETFNYGYFYYSGQSPIIAYNPASSFGLTDFIEVNGQNFITIGAGATFNGLSSYAVFDANKIWLRNGQDANHYIFVNGDYYIQFVYDGMTTEVVKNRAVTLGDVYLFEEYSENIPLNELEERVTVLENASSNIALVDVKNGSPIIYGNVENWIGATTKNIEEDYITFEHVSTGNSWCYSPIFTPLGSNLIHVRFTAEYIARPTGKSIRVVLGETASVGDKYFYIGEITEDGVYDIKFDPAYYAVYEGFSTYCIWILNDSIGAAETISIKLTNLQVLELNGELKGANISGENAKILFESTDLELTDIKSQIGGTPTLTSPSGAKFELQVSDSGIITSAPIIPNKGAFIGNSLIGGFGYGMAASEAQYDYYNRINSYIDSINPSYTYYKASNGGLENAETEGALVAAIAAIVASLTGDENLVSIQLGDNVNNEARNAIFNEGGGCLRTLQAVRAKCPNARVVWIGMWYGDTTKYNTIETSCKATGSKFISFADLLGTDSNSAIGNIAKLGTATRTLEGVTNVVVNTSTNITVTFEISAVVYHSTLDVTSHSLVGTTLTYTGEWEIITSSGVASHPGDNGFRKITNKFLYQMGLTDNPEYYT